MMVDRAKDAFFAIILLYQSYLKSKSYANHFSKTPKYEIIYYPCLGCVTSVYNKKSMSNRVSKINALLESEIAPLVGHLRDNKIQMITVTGVETAADLSNATVWLSVLPDDQNDERVLALVRKESRHIHSQLSSRLVLKKMPKLSFKIDKSDIYVSQVDQLFDQIDKKSNGTAKYTQLLLK